VEPGRCRAAVTPLRQRAANTERLAGTTGFALAARWVGIATGLIGAVAVAAWLGV